MTATHLRLAETTAERDEWRRLAERLAEALREYRGGPKACGHDFECLCTGDRAKALLTEYDAHASRRAAAEKP